MWVGILLFSCTTSSDDSSSDSSPSVLGLWDVMEKDGMLFPIVLEGEVAQQELGDDQLQQSIQHSQMELREDGTGTLVSYFDMTNVDGSASTFEYAVPMTIDLSEEPYVFVAYDEEVDEELVFLCRVTNSGLMTCSYYDQAFPEEEGSLTLLRPQ